MKKYIFISSLLLFIACGSPQTTNPPEKTVAETPKELQLPKGAYLRDTQRGKILKTYPVRFELAKTVMVGNYEEAYNIVNDILKINPKVRIIVEGNASPDGPAYPYNYRLSQRRSDTSYNYLIKLGVSNSRLLKKAFGEALPEYPTLAENRRCEFVIIMNEEDLKKYNDFAKTVDIKKETKLSN